MCSFISKKKGSQSVLYLMQHILNAIINRYRLLHYCTFELYEFRYQSLSMSDNSSLQPLFAVFRHLFGDFCQFKLTIVDH